MTFPARLSIPVVARAANLGLTQRQVADIAGVSPAAVHKFKTRHEIRFAPPKKAARTPMLEPEQRTRLVDAYNAREAECGGFESADVDLCITLAAADCGIPYPEAAQALREHWARYLGA